MDLFFVVSFLSEAQKETVINIISKKFDRKERSIKPKDVGENEKQHDESTHQNISTEVQVTLKDSSIIIPKTENNENLEEVAILKTEKDPLDIDETMLKRVK